VRVWDTPLPTARVGALEKASAHPVNAQP